MTGGIVEIRAEGMLLQLPEDRLTTSTLTPMFPAATAGRWFALKVLDASAAEGSPDESGRIALSSAQVDGVTERVYVGNFGALTKELKESPARLRSVVERILAGLGGRRGVRVLGGLWTLGVTVAAGRPAPRR
jgi:hypothetical protein